MLHLSGLYITFIPSNKQLGRLVFISKNRVKHNNICGYNPVDNNFNDNNSSCSSNNNSNNDNHLNSSSRTKDNSSDIISNNRNSDGNRTTRARTATAITSEITAHLACYLSPSHKNSPLLGATCKEKQEQRRW
jgi:hypothetical protein